MSIGTEIESVISKVESIGQTVVTDSKDILSGPFVAEFLKVAAYVKTVAGSPEVLAAVEAAGISSTQAPVLISSVVGGIVALESLLTQAQAVANPPATT